MKHTAQIGSISQGTLRTEDLLSTFASELESLVFLNGDHFAMPENFSQRDKLANLIGEAQDAWNEDGETLQDEDTAVELVAELCDALEQFAKPYCYFGAHCGDGSGFGFWPSMDAIDELPHESEREDGEDYKVVSDHGNVAVYGGDGVEILGVV